eukprot:CAMPEP_0172540804 /NCGR_PEP_ID=MMETSP1067-20121228/11732_1 /TAXON_ID=265564 ORGANISM="Thalassiosira punctigera, Strain Tpunct2005C2" /NCGR_SAMPLE_ID=MMETSP1067 /ASSEMBLY_ACC=CAM_ASM_000444 /LENGTH=348 /DNA_ID=CAMNT_0013326721 /DNA_START=153 /DNA_END=1199 /DNA_ORIENTATION=+
MTKSKCHLRHKFVGLLGAMCAFSFIALHLPPLSGNKRMKLENTLMQFMPSEDGRRHLRLWLFNDPKTVKRKRIVTGTTTEEMPKLQLALPNILFIGAQKAGSTSVSTWLFRGGVCRAEIFADEPIYFGKEVHFFDKKARYDRGVEFYARRFQHCLVSGNTEFIMDATPDYLTYPTRIAEVYANAGPEALSKLKLMVILREPISRELSLYNHMIFYGHEGLTFEQHAVSIRKGKGNPHWVSTGKYVNHLKKFASFLSREQILVLSYDEVRTDPKKTQWRIQQFLGGEFPGELETLNTHENPNKLRVVSPKARKVLGRMFEKKNEELYEFLETNPGPWMEQRPFPRFYLE